MKNQPLGGNDMPRFGGLTTFMRLPASNTANGLDAAFIGIPMDIGTSHRSGTRFGPRQIRACRFQEPVAPFRRFSDLRDQIYRWKTGAGQGTLHTCFRNVTLIPAMCSLNDTDAGGRR